MAQIGRARGSGSRGRRFESCHSDHMSHRGTTPRDVTYHLNLPIRNLANSQNWQGLRRTLYRFHLSTRANRGSESCHGFPLTASSQTEVQNPVTDNLAALTSGPSRTSTPTSLQIPFHKVFENPKNFFQKVFWWGVGQRPASLQHK